jgi:hypothetical protein
LFASQYNTWEGFFEVVKQYMPYTLTVYFGLALIISLVSYLIFIRPNKAGLSSSRKI